MKFLRNKLDKHKPHFQKGGKLSFLHSVFDGLETFMFVPDHTTASGSHIRDGIDLKRTMFIVVMALIPVTLFGMWNIGYQNSVSIGQTETIFNDFLFGFLQTLPIILVSYGVGLGIEFAFAQVKGHGINEGFLVSGLLIPLCLPPDVPLWMVAIATAFAVVVGKEVFGGTGMNILNPALTARVFLYIAYPGEMSGDLVWVTGLKEGGAEIINGFSGATTLGVLAAGEEMSITTWDAFMGWIPGSFAETSTLLCIVGAVFLIITGVGSWTIMVSTVLGGLLMGWILNLIGGNPYYDLPALNHLLIGGFAFGAIFMATDPVSAAQTSTGKWVYGALIGILTVLIRVFNPAYPEGIMFAILFMNVMAPLVDYYVVKSNIKRRLNRVKV
jgi:Na+-transporting NADH:ubiquinone oxidoreductase subunit B